MNDYSSDQITRENETNLTLIKIVSSNLLIEVSVTMKYDRIIK